MTADLQVAFRVVDVSWLPATESPSPAANVKISNGRRESLPKLTRAVLSRERCRAGRGVDALLLHEAQSPAFHSSKIVDRALVK